MAGAWTLGGGRWQRTRLPFSVAEAIGDATEGTIESSVQIMSDRPEAVEAQCVHDENI